MLLVKVEHYTTLRNPPNGRADQMDQPRKTLVAKPDDLILDLRDYLVEDKMDSLKLSPVLHICTVTHITVCVQAHTHIHTHIQIYINK